MRALAASVVAVVLLAGVTARADDEPAPITAPATEPPPAPAPTSASPAPAAAPAPQTPAPYTLPPVARDPLAVAGAPAPATAAGSLAPREWPIRPGLEIFADYRYTRTYAAGGSTWYHELGVPRVHASIDAAVAGVRGRVLLEAVRSTSEGSLVGVATDSLVLRLREAFAGYAPLDFVDLKAGVVPTLTLTELDGTWMLRAAAPSALEGAGLASPADLGATARVEAPRRFGWLGVGVYDGEGYASRELNRGKNVEIAALGRPAPGTALLPLALFASYSLGSTGVARARSDRLTGSILWQGERVRAGAAFTYAWGVGPVGAQRALLADVFVRVEPIERLLLGARASYFVRDDDAPSTDAITQLLLSAGFRIAAPLEVHLVGSRALPTTLTKDALPASDALDLRAVGRVFF